MREKYPPLRESSKNNIQMKINDFNYLEEVLTKMTNTDKKLIEHINLYTKEGKYSKEEWDEIWKDLIGDKIEIVLAKLEETNPTLYESLADVFRKRSELLNAIQHYHNLKTIIGE